MTKNTIPPLSMKDGESRDLIAENIATLQALFPEVVTEGKGGKSIDFEALRAILGDAVEEGEERYSFTWNGKAEARRFALTPSTATLRPCPEESVNWDSTQHLYIEGDNLEALKVLQKSYFNKIKMIYIDPPYNTGKDFIYPDNYKDSLKNYLELTGQTDEEGRKLQANTESNGRYHTDWLNMIYPRLVLARTLLAEDGVIFISINDKEAHNLRKICDEIFGEENFLCQFVWENEGNIDNQKRIKIKHEYILLYAKRQENLGFPNISDKNIPQESKLNKDVIENTIVKNGPKNPKSDITLPIGFPSDTERGIFSWKNGSYPYFNGKIIIENFKLASEVTLNSGWSSNELLADYIKNEFSTIVDAKGQETSFYIKQSGAVYIKKIRNKEIGHVLSILRQYGTVQQESSDLENNKIYFSYPKPKDLILFLVKMFTEEGDICLDFFSGSAPLGDVILSLEGKNEKRRFILIQLPEMCPKGSPAYAAGDSTISKLAQRRLLMRCTELNKANPLLLSTLGFRVYKLDSSNLHPWDAESFRQSKDLFAGVDNIKHDRSDDDIRTEILLKYGHDLALPCRKETVFGVDLYIYGAGLLVLCLQKRVPTDKLLAVAEYLVILRQKQDMEEMRVLFRDSTFTDDVAKANVMQILTSGKIMDVRSL